MLDLLRLVLLSLCIIAGKVSWIVLNAGVEGILTGEGLAVAIPIALAFSFLFCLSAYAANILVYQLLEPF